MKKSASCLARSMQNETDFLDQDNLKSAKRIVLEVEEAANRTKWRERVRAIAGGMRCIRPTSVTRNTLD